MPCFLCHGSCLGCLYFFSSQAWRIIFPSLPPVHPSGIFVGEIGNLGVFPYSPVVMSTPPHVAKSLTLKCSFADENAPFHWLYFAEGFSLHS